MRVIDILPSPEEMKERLAPSNKAKKIKTTRDASIANILGDCPPPLGTVPSPSLLLIIGPCSAHCPSAVLEYIEKLSKVATDVSSKILIIPRVYTAKPRTAGTGYMGLLHEPNGLFTARKLHLDILENFGLSCADEMLYPALMPYFDDLISYFAVGARSVLNQEHKLVASGLNIPVGMKNPLSGDLKAMQAAVAAAHKPHDFIFRGNFIQTSGNPLAHGVLRGQADAPNYTRSHELNMPLIIDASHGNSCKNPLNQRNVALDALKLPNIKGIMIESFTHEGQSITDPCLPWPQTKELIHELLECL